MKMFYTIVMNRFHYILIIKLLISSIQCQFQRNYDINNVSVQFIEQIQRNYQTNVSLELFDVMREMQLENIIKAYVKSDLNRTLQINSVNNTQCDLQFSMFATGLRESELWALKMIDSSSKIPGGILEGNMKDLGFYDECISVKVKRDEEIIEGRHCMYTLSVKVPNTTISLSSTLSACLPAVCNSEHVALILQNAVDKTSSYHDKSLRIGSTRCTTIAPVQWEINDIVAIMIIMIFIIFLSICTILDVLIRVNNDAKMKNNAMNELAKFSFYTNAKRILNTTIPNDNLPAIQGLRFFSMCWVIFGHEYALLPVGAVTNMADISGWINSWQALYILIAPFSVDTFFVISGFLTSYLFLKEISKRQTFNLPMYYVHRYLRLTPSLGALLLLTIYIFPKIGSGALWESVVSSQGKLCSNNWWTMMLYIQNFVDTDYMWCLTHTWYLAVDMQLFWISPLILYPLAKKPKLGLIILVIFLIASIITPAVIAGEYQYSIALFTDLRRMEKTLINFYIKTYTRTGPWLLGIFLGYELVDKKHKLSNNFVHLGWILTVLMFAFTFFSYRVFQSDDYQWNVSWEVFYAACARHIWAFAICWIIYASVIGHGGFISKFLSMPIFMPFGRISYSIYLIHFSILSMKVGALRNSQYFSDLNQFYSFLCDFLLCSSVGFVFSLIFESPFMVAEKIIIKKRRNEGKQERRKGNDARVYKNESKY